MRICCISDRQRSCMADVMARGGNYASLTRFIRRPNGSGASLSCEPRRILTCLSSREGRREQLIITDIDFGDAGSNDALATPALLPRAIEKSILRHAGFSSDSDVELHFVKELPKTKARRDQMRQRFISHHAARHWRIVEHPAVCQRSKRRIGSAFHRI